MSVMSSNMSWGTELWDQFDRITDHTQKGIEFCEKYSHFVKDRVKLEVDYANNLRKLTKNYLPRKKEEEIPFTVVKSFYDSLKEINDIAGQHELLAESLKSTVFEEISKLIGNLKSERKKHMEEAKKLENQLQSQMRALDQSKRRYERSFQEQLRAEETYRNADANLNLSRAELEKAKNVSIQRAQQCSDCKGGYAHSLEQTNAHQREYYNKLLPQVFQSMQEMDESRIVKIQQSIKSMSDIEKNIQPIVNTCLDEIAKASEKVDPNEDSRRVIDRFKSGFVPPDDIPFEDLENEENKSVNSNHKASRETIKSNTVSGPRATKKKEKGGLKGLFGGRASEPEREDFGHLVPQQQKKHLKEKIKQIKHQITKECAEREGMVKMQEVYQGNPKLGDANSLNSQLEDNKRKIDGLEQELTKFEGYLAAAEGNGGTPTMTRRSSGGSYQSNNSGDTSNSQSTPASAVNGSTPGSLTVSQNPTPTRQAGSMYSIRSTHSSSYTQFYDDSLQALDDGSAMADSFDNDSFDEADAEEPLAVIGQAMALYQFDATTLGSLSMVPDEEFAVVEKDNGDGWTRIRKSTGEEGFVPTSYIKIH